ncbi:hypothetical protein KIPB_004855, partial [Kipferlia bialata]|eukprot:g4855.t1
MLFCPVCANILLVEKTGLMRFFCPTCSYVYELKGRMESSLRLQSKK